MPFLAIILSGMRRSGCSGLTCAESAGSIQNTRINQGGQQLAQCGANLMPVALHRIGGKYSTAGVRRRSVERPHRQDVQRQSGSHAPSARSAPLHTRTPEPCLPRNAGQPAAAGRSEHTAPDRCRQARQQVPGAGSLASPWVSPEVGLPPQEIPIFM